MVEPEKLCEDSDEDMTREEWAETVVADSYPEVEYGLPEFQLIKPGMYVLVKFIGGHRKSTHYKYVCRVRDLDEESGDIEVVGFRRNDTFATEFIEIEKDISSIEFDMIEAILPDAKVTFKSRKIIHVFPGTVSVFEK